MSFDPTTVGRKFNELYEQAWSQGGLDALASYTLAILVGYGRVTGRSDIRSCSVALSLRAGEIFPSAWSKRERLTMLF
jgi:hypothetical protein